MKTGIIFDIKEFAIHDGPGLRTTVFLKGCPLDCSWCHNPEGKSIHPQIMRTDTSERLVGREYTSEDLANQLNRHVDIHKLNGGGITFSGGEPLLQADFVAEVIDHLDRVHVLLDTSGYGNPEDFRHLIRKFDMVYFDLKIIDPLLFREHTGGDVQVVLENLQTLSRSNLPYVIRVPLIPDVTDTEENLSAIVDTINGLPGLQRLDLLPYNQMAGSKYRSFAMEFRPNFDETAVVKTRSDAFRKLNVPWGVV